MVKPLQDTPSGLAADIFAAKLAYATYLHSTATEAGPPNGNGTPIANRISVGTTTTLTATVTGNSPSGTVTFKDGAATVGTATVTSGSAQIATTSLSGGAHSLTAGYGDDAQNIPGASSAVTLNVSDPVTPPAATLTGIADGAVFTAAAGGAYTGASRTLTAPARERLESRLSLSLGPQRHRYGWKKRPLLAYSVEKPGLHEGSGH